MNSNQFKSRQAFFTRSLSASFDSAVLEKAVDRVIENQDRYYALLRSTQEPGIETLITSIHNSNFFRTHSHSHHHYPSGLVEHSLGVYDQMVRIAKGSGLSDKDLILTALLHDICMSRKNGQDWPRIPGGHGQTSRLIAETYLPGLSPEVKLAIARHRHSPHGQEVTRHPLWALVRKADIADAATSPGGTLKFMELALGHKDEVMDKHFRKEKIISLLRLCERANMPCFIQWLREESSYFEAPASKTQHNAFRGGLAKHSLDVYGEAMALNKSYGLPEKSITICALLHDVCKHDQYYIDRYGEIQRNQSKIDEGHGFRSVEIIKRFGVTLNEDETMAIWWHMGQFESSLKKYPEVYEQSKAIPLVQLISKADGIAAAKAK